MASNKRSATTSSRRSSWLAGLPGRLLLALLVSLVLLFVFFASSVVSY